MITVYLAYEEYCFKIEGKHKGSTHDHVEPQHSSHFFLVYDAEQDVCVGAFGQVRQIRATSILT